MNETLRVRDAHAQNQKINIPRRCHLRSWMSMIFSTIVGQKTSMTMVRKCLHKAAALLTITFVAKQYEQFEQCVHDRTTPSLTDL